MLHFTAAGQVAYTGASSTNKRKADRMPSSPFFYASSFSAIRDGLATAFAANEDVFPKDPAAAVLLKPNLNANMNALTGNTTDLRLLSAVLSLLKDRGYRNITVGEGTNSGFYRNRIGVISRLMVDRLCDHYGVAVLDCNHSPRTVDVPFEDGVVAKAAAICAEADLFINMPVVKTHFEAGMTVCLKNLMGCLVGQESKKKTHKSLAANILNLNAALTPHLHVVDALVAMEGLGPTRGVPKRLDLVGVGRDPYLMDLACARLAHFSWRQVRTLALAEKRGLLTKEHFDAVDAMELDGLSAPFAPPKAGPLATFIHHPSRQKYFLAVRNTPFFTYLAGTDWFGRLLFKTGLRQDVFCKDEMACQGLSLDPERCDDKAGCRVCRDFCPLGLDPVEALKGPDSACLGCLYCFMTCPRRAIGFLGEMGFLEEQMRQYDSLIRNMAAEAPGVPKAAGTGEGGDE